ncbi:hypothetical protein D3C71_2129320 [compost metagenome]
MAGQISRDGFPALPIDILGQIYPVNASIPINKFGTEPVEAFITVYLQLDCLGLSRYSRCFVSQHGVCRFCAAALGKVIL